DEFRQVRVEEMGFELCREPVLKWWDEVQVAQGRQWKWLSLEEVPVPCVSCANPDSVPGNAELSCRRDMPIRRMGVSNLASVLITAQSPCRERQFMIDDQGAEARDVPEQLICEAYEHGFRLFPVPFGPGRPLEHEGSLGGEREQ